MGDIFVWVDLETTGLDPELHKILEFAVIVTHRNLTEIFRYETLVDGPLEGMNGFVLDMHTKSGLIEAHEKQEPARLKDVEQIVLSALRKYEIPKGKAYLCGNSVHFDRKFLAKHMPDLLAHLHYRQLDVSTLKIVWGDVLPFDKGEAHHRAMLDLEASISEYKHYITNLEITDGSR